MRFDHFTGAAHFSLPLPISAHRGIEPDLALSYSSMLGGSAFGLGFDVVSPRISCRTEHGVPLYDGSERFNSSIAGEIVPALEFQDPNWVAIAKGQFTFRGQDYETKPFRPRTDTHFLRIEWCVPVSGDGPSFWRILRKDNYSEIYGYDYKSREADPNDPDRVFAWLISEATDARGNQICYDYIPDPAGPGKRHLSAVRYGRFKGDTDAWHFHVVFDYSKRDVAAQKRGPYKPPKKAFTRPDATTSYKAGFAQRSTLLCGNVLLYHQFGRRKQFLVRGLHLDYARSAIATHLLSATTIGVRSGKTLDLPSAKFAYTQAKPRLEYKPLSLVDGTPFGGTVDQLVDVDRDGLPGLLSMQGTTLLYAKPKGGGCYAGLQPLGHLPASVASRDSAFALTSLDANTRLDLVDHNSDRRGYYPVTEGKISGLKTFEQYPTAVAGLISGDLSGDGRADLVSFERSQAAVYVSRGSKGVGTAIAGGELPADFPTSRAKSPAEFIGIIDLIGDGGAHMVSVTRDRIYLWPSLGWGTYGARMKLSEGEIFGPNFDPRRLHFADADGYGAQDMLYLGADGLKLFTNLAGNGFDLAKDVALPKNFGAGDPLRFADILGSGTSCVLATISDASGRRRHMYCDLSGEQKPGLLCQMKNGIGLVTDIDYSSSVATYQAVGGKGRHPPNPVQVVSKMTQTDLVIGKAEVTDFRYHLGTYNAKERAFEGFALVEMEVNVRSGSSDFDSPPVLIREWFHTGFALPGQLSEDFRQGETLFRYATAGDAFGIPTQHAKVLAKGIKTSEVMETATGYAMRGKVLRTETFLAEGFEPGKSVPLLTSERTYAVHGLQQEKHSSDPVCQVTNRETVECHIDGTPDDLRLQQALTLKVNAYGLDEMVAHIDYPRRVPKIDAQSKAVGTCATRTYLDPVSNGQVYLAGIGYEEASYEINVSGLKFGTLWTVEDLVKILPKDQPGQCIARHREYYLGTDGLIFGDSDAELAPQVLLAFGEEAVLPEKGPSDELAGFFSAERMKESGHVIADGYWWRRSAKNTYDMDQQRHYPLIATVDSFKGRTTVTFDDSGLFIKKIKHPDKSIERAFYDKYSLKPKRHQDENDVISEALYDALGYVVATSTHKRGDNSVIGDGRLRDHTLKIATGPKDAADRAGDILGDASTVHLYDPLAWQRDGVPCWTADIHRQEFAYGADGKALTKHLSLITAAYTDGHDQILQSKTTDAPGPGFQRGDDGTLLLGDDGHPATVQLAERWLSSGWEVENNAGLPVLEYEPYFISTPEFDNEPVLRSLRTATHNTFDVLGRLVRTNNPEGTFSEELFSPWGHISRDEIDTLDSSDRYLNCATDPNIGAAEIELLERWVKQGETREEHQFDVMGHVSQTSQTISATETLVIHEKHDVLGQMVSSAYDKHPPSIEAIYDMVGQVIYTHAADAGPVTTLFDCMGATSFQLDGNGQQHRMEYDKAHELCAVWLSVEGGKERQIEKIGHGANTVANRERNRVGRQIFVHEDSGSETIANYDLGGAASVYSVRAFGRNDVTNGGADPSALELSKTVRRDALGRVVDVQFGVGLGLRYGYDRGHGLETLEITQQSAPSLPVVLGSDYSALGERVWLKLGSGIERHFKYDTLSGEMIAMRTEVDENTVQDVEFLHDPMGNIAIRTNRLADQKTQFEYDGLARLVTRDDIEGGETFRYDKRGNLLQHEKAGVVVEQIYETKNNRIVGDGISYDLRGNLTSAEGHTFGWDSKGMLSSVAMPDQTLVAYGYGLDGQRRTRISKDANGLEASRSLSVDQYHIERLGQIETHRIDLHDGHDVVATLQMRTESGNLASDELTFLTVDELGSAVLITGPDGEQNSRTFAPYGEASPAAQKAGPGYMGKLVDPATGLVDFGARVYSPTIKRWLSPDPAGAVDGLNLFQFVRSNPVNLVDVQGHVGGDKEENRKKSGHSGKEKSSSGTPKSSSSSSRRLHSNSYQTRDRRDLSHCLRPEYRMRRGAFSTAGHATPYFSDTITAAATQTKIVGNGLSYVANKAVGADSGPLQKFNHVHEANEAHQAGMSDRYKAARSSADKLNLANKAVGAAAKKGGNMMFPVLGGVVAKAVATRPLKGRYLAQLDKAHDAIPDGKEASQMDGALRLTNRAEKHVATRSPLTHVKETFASVRHGAADKSTTALRITYLATQGVVKHTHMDNSTARAPSAREQAKNDRKVSELLRRHKEEQFNSPNARRNRRQERNATWLHD